MVVLNYRTGKSRPSGALSVATWLSCSVGILQAALLVAAYLVHKLPHFHLWAEDFLTIACLLAILGGISGLFSLRTWPGRIGLLLAAITLTILATL
jgi:hypothetical protein